MNIYLDTMLWNALCDQDVDPLELVKTLASNKANLTFSNQTTFELARTFLSAKPQVAERGRKLFSHFKKFIDANTPCAKDNMELLIAELEALRRRTASVDTFLSGSHYESLRNEVGKLANGNFDERARSFIENRLKFSSNTRSGQAGHLEIRTETKEILKGISPDKLESWLQSEAAKPIGVTMLTDHIVRAFHNAPRIELESWASALLAAYSGNRMARGLVRADLYYNWRCANRNSNPTDLVDDMYHVLNSVYCDVYATGEEKQQEYAGLLLTANTKVAIYHGQEPMGRWVVGLA